MKEKFSQLLSFCNDFKQITYYVQHFITVAPHFARMTEITFALVRSQNPEISTAGDIEEIDCIRLINCGIEEIDNLELFHHINELHLSQNQITSLENLSILFKLKILDVSYNNITSEGLRKSIASLPKSLISINLTGNPCVNDEEGLLELQDAIPEVIIAIDIENDEAQQPRKGGKLSEEKEDDSLANTERREKEQRDGENEEDEEEGNENERENVSQFLSNEDVLKSIVERKCLIQNTTSTFKLENAVQVRHELLFLYISLALLIMLFVGFESRVGASDRGFESSKAK